MTRRTTFAQAALLTTLLCGAICLGATEEIALDLFEQVSVLPLKAETHHVQGIAVEDGVLWVSSVARKSPKGFLQIFSISTGELLKEAEIQDGLKIHPGGIQLDGAAVWVPVAEYHRQGASHIEQRDKSTLELISRFSVDDHIGCLAVSPDGPIYGGNWDARHIYCWDRQGNLIWKKNNPLPSRYQDMKFADGKLVGSGEGPDGGVMEWLDPQTLACSRRIMGGKTDRGVGFMHEGMELRHGRLYLLPEDTPSRLFIFELP